MRAIRLQINGDWYEVGVRDSETLLEVLRDRLRLTGTKRGCDEGACGSCTVLLDGEPTLSCLLLAASAEGHEVTTIEGVAGLATATNGWVGPGMAELHPIQKAFAEVGAVQCGFCTPGMVLSTLALLRENPNPSEPAIRRALSGNICRCTGYVKIVEGVRRAAELMAAGGTGRESAEARAPQGSEEARAQSPAAQSPTTTGLQKESHR